MPACLRADPTRRGARVGQSLDRLVAFSDGVFAIAMTLLVLNFTVPTSPDRRNVNQKLSTPLSDQWPELFSYVLSFVVIGRFWLVHHRLSRLVRRIDAPCSSC